MSLLVVLLIFGASYSSAQELPRYEKSEVSPMAGDSISPVSPILGNRWVSAIRSDARSPDEIFAAIQAQYPDWKDDLYRSVDAYYSTLTPGLEQFCDTPKTSQTIPDEHAFSTVEQAAIPFEILNPLNEAYRQNLQKAEQVPPQSESAKRLALDFEWKRLHCGTVNSVRKIEEIAKKLLPKHFDRLVDLHHRISAPEAPYPRVQFTLNGYTQYVYGELFKLSIDRLDSLMRSVLDAETLWVEKSKQGESVPSFVSFVERQTLNDGFLPREILLALSYSTRNMPSLDIQYSVSPEKSLLLEIYFWKFHPIRNQVQAEYEHTLYPDRAIKRNPGLYHYVTSALMACEIRLSGYSGAVARILAFADKFAYKTNKLVGEIHAKRVHGNPHGIREVFDTAKKQAFRPGIQAGRFGGKQGLRFCARFTPKDRWLKNLNPENEAPDAEFTEAALRQIEIGALP